MFEDQYKPLFIAQFENYQYSSELTHSRVSHLLLCFGRLLFGNASEKDPCLYDGFSR